MLVASPAQQLAGNYTQILKLRQCANAASHSRCTLTGVYLSHRHLSVTVVTVTLDRRTTAISLKNDVSPASLLESLCFPCDDTTIAQALPVVTFISGCRISEVVEMMTEEDSILDGRYGLPKAHFSDTGVCVASDKKRLSL